MIVLVYVTIIIVFIYVLSTFVQFDTKDSINDNANFEKTPEEMSIPIYRPFKDGPFQMTMRLQSLDLHQWIQINGNYRQEMKLKEQILNGPYRDDFFICKDETYSAAMEVLTMLIDYLPNQYPNMFEKTHSKSTITNLITKKTFDLTRPNHLHPLEIAACLIQEDLVIMQRNPMDDTYHANALAVCFPSGWLPKSKFGLPLAYIHMPQVPFFQERLRTSMDKYFLKLREENPVQRLNWTLQIGNDLCQREVEGETNEMITNTNAGQLIYLRVERQTLRRLPISKSILFTIKTYMTKIEDVCRDDPNMAKELAGAVRNWPQEMIEYKGAQRYKESLLAYLDQPSF